MRLVAIGLLAGFFSALFGVGGGIVAVPLLILVAGFEPRSATATSLRDPSRESPALLGEAPKAPATPPCPSTSSIRQR